jgi:hypothetical protein
MALLHLLNHTLSWHKSDEWSKTVSFLNRLYASFTHEFENTRDTARIVAEKINDIDGFIQKHTAEVCPDCRQVCCINKHGYYDYEDLIYIHALGLTPPVYKEGLKDTEPCQFLSDRGCVIERSVRPFRCNWYFCDALIKNIEVGNARDYRHFSRKIEEIMYIRNDMFTSFFKAATVVEKGLFAVHPEEVF